MASSGNRNNKKTSDSSNNNPLAAFSPKRTRSSRQEQKKKKPVPSKSAKDISDDNNTTQESPMISVEIPARTNLGNKDQNSKTPPHITSPTYDSEFNASNDERSRRSISLSDTERNRRSIAPSRFMDNSYEEQGYSKRKNNSFERSNVSKLPRLNEKDANLLYKAIEYSKNAYEEALEAKEAAVRTELAIKEFIKESSSSISEEGNNIDNAQLVKHNRRQKFWYSDTLIKACNDLFQNDKNPTDDGMREAIYNSLVNAHPDQIEKIECVKDGWFKYWTEVLQTLARYEFRVKRAGYVRNIKQAIINVFGKAFIGKFPSSRAPSTDVMRWKSSKNVKWAHENLWNCVNTDDDHDPDDTYINRITKEILKENELTDNNCLFIVAIVDLIFDPNIQTTTLSSELITKRMVEKAEESGSRDVESDDDHNENATRDDM